jgi:hypothetical protein
MARIDIKGTAGGGGGGSGTVTSVSIATGTSGTNVNATGTVTSAGTLTVNIPTASATNTGKLSNTDWSTFNSKGNGTVTSVAALTLGTAGTDLSSSVATGTTTPVITLDVPTASASNRGALNSTDWSTFNSKQAALVSGTNIKTINGTSVLGAGNIAVTATPAGSTSEVQFNNAGAFDSDANFIWDDTNKRLGLGIAAPLGILHLKVSAGTTRQVIDGDAGQSKIITFRTAGLQRWGLYSNNVAESGANAGSNFVLRRYNDAGTLLGTPLEVNRATGVTKIGEGLDLNGSELTNFSADVETLTASLEFNAANSATYNGRVIQMSNACAFTFNNSLPIGFSATFIQTDANTSTFAGVGSVIVNNRQGHSSNNGQYSVVSIVKINSLQFILGGDTA